MFLRFARSAHQPCDRRIDEVRAEPEGEQAGAEAQRDALVRVILRAEVADSNSQEERELGAARRRRR